MNRICLLFLFLLSYGFTSAQISLPGNMWPDTACAPFIYGVASGDPLPDGVILWTALDEAAVTGTVSLNWEISTDSAFATITTSGTANVDSTTGFALKIDVSGLSQNTTYWYRFREPGGTNSQTGRTRTAPSGNPGSLVFGVASCSSIYSGYFNAYREIGDRNDLNLFIHLGDYIYDEPDPDELERIPVPAPTQPYSLEDYRTRQQYYLLDPDLRWARQRHPFTVIWDNHDVESDSAGQYEAAIQSFWEFLPCRQPDSLVPDRVYRHLAYGDLVDLYMTDGHTFRGDDTLPTGEPSYLGTAQYNWLSGELQNSTAVWRFIGNQKMMGQWSTGGIPGLPIGNGDIADPSSWDGFPESRNQLLDFLEGNGIENDFFLSGDLHLSMSTDVTQDPFDGNAYDSNTGAGSIGVEFLPSSLTRGNFDEYGIPGFLIPGIKAASDAINPHHFYSEFEEHGYGIVKINADSCIAEYHYVGKSNPGQTGSLAASMVVRSGENHWARGPAVSIAEAVEGWKIEEIGPNPTKDAYHFRLQIPQSEVVEIDLVELSSGKLLKTIFSGEMQAGVSRTFQAEMETLPNGIYGVRIRTQEQQGLIKVVKVN